MMTEPITWTAVAMAFVSNVGTWLYIMRGKKTNSNNRGSKPGQAEVCIERGEKLARMEEKQSNYEKDIEEIKADIKDIKQAVAAK